MSWLSFLYKGQERNLVDELPYWDIVDKAQLADDPVAPDDNAAVMVLNNGRAEAGVSLELLPSLFTPPLAQVVNMSRAALRSTPEGTRARFVTSVGPSSQRVLNHYRALTDAPEAVAHTLSEGRHQFLEAMRQQGHITEWRSHMSVAFGPTKRKNLKALSSAELARTLREGERITLRLTRFLEQAGFRPRPLRTQDIYETCHQFFNPSLAGCDLSAYTPTAQTYPAQAVKKFKGLRAPTLRSQLLKSPVNNSYASHLKVGDHFVKMIAMHTIPEETYASMGNLFLRTGVEFAVVIDVTHEPFDKAIRKIKQQNRTGFATVGNDEVYVDSDVEEGLSEGRELLRFIHRSGDHIYRVSACLVLMGRDLRTVEEATLQAVSTLAHIPGNPFRVLGEGLFGPWCSVAPFSGEQYEEYVSLVETNAAHFLPFSGPWRGSERPLALYHTRYRTLAAVDTFDPRNKNWHALFLGATRMGKTFTAQYQLSETLRRSDVDAVIIDRGLSWQRLVDHFEGDVIPIETGGKVSINPFDLEPGHVRPDEAQKSFLGKLLRAMIPSEGGAVEADEDSILVSAIEEAYDAAVTEMPDERGDWVETFEPFILSDYVETLLTLSAIGDRPINEEERAIASSLARRLQVWCGDTPLGRFIDRPTSLTNSDARVVLYETSSFNDQPKLDAVGTMLIQRAVWKRATQHKARKMVLATDEAWAILQNPFAVKFQIEMLRRGAREGIAVWLLTHSILDVLGEEHAGIIQGLSSFYLFQLKGEDELLQSTLRLDDALMEDYRSLTGKKGEENEFLFFTEREDGREGEVLVLRPSKVDYYLFTNHADDLAKLETKTRELGSEAAAVKALAYG